MIDVKPTNLDQNWTYVVVNVSMVEVLEIERRI